MKIDFTQQELELLLDCIAQAEAQDATQDLILLREKIELLMDE